MHAYAAIFGSSNMSPLRNQRTFICTTVKLSLVPPLLSRVLLAETSSLHATVHQAIGLTGRHIKLADCWHSRRQLAVSPLSQEQGMVCGRLPLVSCSWVLTCTRSHMAFLTVLFSVTPVILYCTVPCMRLPGFGGLIPPQKKLCILLQSLCDPCLLPFTERCSRNQG